MNLGTDMQIGRSVFFLLGTPRIGAKAEIARLVTGIPFAVPHRQSLWFFVFATAISKRGTVL